MTPEELRRQSRRFERATEATLRDQRSRIERHFQDEDARRRAAEHRATEKPERQA